MARVSGRVRDRAVTARVNGAERARCAAMYARTVVRGAARRRGAGRCATASRCGAARRAGPARAAARLAGAAPGPAAAHARRRATLAATCTRSRRARACGRRCRRCGARSATTPTGVLVADRGDARPRAGACRSTATGRRAGTGPGRRLAGRRARAPPRAVVARPGGGRIGARGRRRPGRPPPRRPASASSATRSASRRVRELVRLTWLAGDRTGALDVYDRFRERLRAERGVAPSPETRRLVGRAARRCRRAGAAAAGAAAGAARPRAAGAPLVGRADELVAARGAYERDPPGRHRPAARRGRAGHRQDAARGRARDRCTWWEGAAVLAGRVAEDALVPYQAWVEALAGLPGGGAARGGGRADGPRRAGARADPARPSAREPAPAEDRFRLLEAVAGLLAGDRPRAADGAACSTTCTGRSARA